MISFQIRSVLSCSIAFLPELWIIHHPLSVHISTHCECNIFLFFFSFRWHGCKQSKMSECSWVEEVVLYFWWTWRFSPPWLIYFWVTFYLGNLVDLNEISVLHWCVCVHQCMCLSVVTAIKWKKSPYQTICFSQWRLTAQRRRDLCWPWTAD